MIFVFGKIGFLENFSQLFRKIIEMSILLDLNVILILNEISFFSKKKI